MENLKRRQRNYGSNYYEDIFVMNDIDKNKLKSYLGIFVSLFETIIDYYPFEYNLSYRDGGGIERNLNPKCDPVSHFGFCVKKINQYHEFNINSKSNLYKKLYEYFRVLVYEREESDYEYHLNSYQKLKKLRIENRKQIDNIKKIYSIFNTHDKMHKITETKN